MNDQQDVTLGEVHRLCLEIRRDVRSQNGRVTALEKDAIQIKTLWTATVIIVGFFGDWLRHKLGMS